MDVGKEAYEQASARFTVCCGCLAAFWLPVYFHAIVVLGRQPLLSLALDLSLQQPLLDGDTMSPSALLTGLFFVLLLLASFLGAYSCWRQRERRRQHYGRSLRELLSIAQELKDERGILEAESELARIQAGRPVPGLGRV